MESKILRNKFLDYFKSKEHRVFSSISLVPRDPTMLFTTAGMVQFKNMFLGRGQENYTRAASSQRCFRTSDIDSVGKTARHLTFFEMLGNFSFGDYFKKEAIAWGWEFLTKELGLPESKLYASVYEEDDEAYGLWKEIIPESRIVKLGKKDNFWEMGETGPCGPCSEIYIDLGEAVGCGDKACKPGCDCDRWIEVWNLVFTQYDKDKYGNLNPLPQKNIDTGMGLERLTTVINGFKSNFETDLLKPIIEYICAAKGIKNGEIESSATALRIMADHARGIAFLVADGVTPLNEGRGYVLRRIIRRAALQAKLLEIELPFIHELTGKVVEMMKEPYPELENYREHILTVTKTEEEHFKKTLDSGMSRLDDIINKVKAIIPGSDLFALYDTYGFPPEMTKEIAASRGLKVDEEGFNVEMTKQKERAKASWKGSGEGDRKIYDEVLRKTGRTAFVGYKANEAESRITAIIKAGAVTDSAVKGDSVGIVLDSTPFYGESGGQCGDRGTIIKANECRIEISNSTKPVEGLVLHSGNIIEGTIKKGDAVRVAIENMNRNSIKRNHTATHILQAALREVLGEHVHQSGSLVAAERLRFDFTHQKALSREELEKIEEKVNDTILQNMPVVSSETGLEEARKMGAMALFNEKYGDRVRIVGIKQKDSAGNFSLELCGGTHCFSTGEIGSFKIVSESGIAAGIRRIEAVTGKFAYRRTVESDSIISGLETLLKSGREGLVTKIESLIKLNKELKKKSDNVSMSDVKQDIESILKHEKTVNGIKIITSKLEGMNQKTLRIYGDHVKNRVKSAIIVLGSIINAKPVLLVMVTNDLVEKGYKAGDIASKLSLLIKGKGGGRPDMAQAGGSEPQNLGKAIGRVEEIISGIVIK